MSVSIETVPMQHRRCLVDSVEVREIDVDGRLATFVAATENGVDTYFGREYLRMSGVDLARFRKNPVVLDTHNRYEAGAVIGRAEVRVEKRQLLADVTFAETERAEEIWQLVQSGFLRALSIGYIPTDVTEVEEGKSDGRGEGKIDGPATVIKKWELYEISVVPVPADPDSLRRGFFKGDPFQLTLAARSLINMAARLIASQEENQMADTPKVAEEVTPEAPVEETETEALEQRDVKIVEIAEEALARQIRAIAPRGLEMFADECVLKCKTFEEARARLMEVQAERMKPVGTPEAPAVESTREPAKGPKPDDVSDEEVVSALAG